LAEILPSRLQDLGLDYDYWPVAMNLRFQFRLRTLMIVVTLLAVVCGYVGWQAKIVRERRAMVDWINNHSGLVGINCPMPRKLTPSIAWVRELLEDPAIFRIELQPDTDATDVQRIRSLFPEADVLVIDFGGLRE
jgi:hypothetical protein